MGNKSKDLFMKRIIAFSIAFGFIFIFSFGQMIDVYHPLGAINPADIDRADKDYSSNPITIVGVVSGESQGGTLLGKAFTVHHITLKAWKASDASDLHFKNLFVMRTVEQERDFFDEIPAYSIVEFKVFLNTNRTRAVLIEGKFIHNPPEDLIAAKIKLQAPVFLESDRFGRFKFDEKIAWFEKELEWNGQLVSVAIQIEDTSLLTDHLQTLEQLMDKQQMWKRKIEDFGVEKLLPLKNDSWLDEGESEWSKNKFISTWQLEAIWIYEDGAFDFWYKDGDIFWGHYIEISGSVKDGPDYAAIQG